MSKRKLSPRQTERATQQQQSRRARSRSPAKSTVDNNDLGPEQPGVVVANYGASLEVESTPGVITLCSVRQNIGELVCGDDVVWRAAGSGRNGGVVVALQPRRTLLLRADAYGHIKTIAANIDLLLVVIAPIPEVSENLLDAYLVATELCGVTPLIVINKCDLLDGAQRKAWDKRMDVYRAIGYDVIFTSVHDESHRATLHARVQGHTSAVVGHSGVGKSSILKTLLPNIEIAIGDVSAAGLGRHTTTTARLYHLSDNARLIDSPGVRDVKLTHITPAQAELGYREFRAYLGQCKFKDCRHLVEPGCAILAAQRSGHIAQSRLASYHKLLKSA